jgi:hypothetical protein
MRNLRHSGFWLVALTMVVASCSRPVERPHKTSVATNLEVLPAASEVVLTVEGMT